MCGNSRKRRRLGTSTAPQAIDAHATVAALEQVFTTRGARPSFIRWKRTPS